jgi:uncharacterized protein (TIGR02265 family)
MPSTDRGKTKGGVFVSRLEFLRERGGQALVDRVLRSLPAGDREVLRGIILASSWYPFEMNERLDKAIGAAVGGGADLFRELGRQSARHNLASAHRNFVRAHDPHGLLRQAATIYRVYYDTGSRSYEKVGPKKAVLRTTGSKSFSRNDCLTIVGYHEEAIRMCGGHHPRVSETKCRARGDDVCEYVIEWE